MKKFNLLSAKAGRPVCLRNGQKARIVSFDKQGDSPLVVLVTDKDEETQTLWFNVYRSEGTDSVIYTLGVSYGSREYAKSIGETKKGYVDTVKVTFCDKV